VYGFASNLRSIVDRMVACNNGSAGCVLGYDDQVLAVKPIRLNCMLCTQLFCLFGRTWTVVPSLHRLSERPAESPWADVRPFGSSQESVACAQFPSR
jgi:hypothetical protein